MSQELCRDCKCYCSIKFYYDVHKYRIECMKCDKKTSYHATIAEAEAEWNLTNKRG